MNKIIPAIIAALFIVIGGAAGFFLKSSGSADASASAASGHEEKSSGHGEKKDDGHGAEKKEKGGHGEEAKGGSGDVTYYRFTREFVVPIISDERVDSLVILNLNLEVDSAVSDKLFSMEPKLRDNIMTTLIKLSNDGHTLHSLTDVENYESIRSLILANLQDVISDGIRNVLILDMAKQDL
ncbi:flagellar basal body-associated FliL family protein [Henriciella sp. AS95]|uniref:flagellar basal body-associated FliL family protein n=1 Tax=Henriciella sp. AS95 TaxID=3135782 RepID=UPI0031725BE4